MISVSSLPASAARRWVQRVFTNTANMTVCQRYLAAKVIANSWVLSPISAKTTKTRDVRNAVILYFSSHKTKKRDALAQTHKVYTKGLANWVQPMVRPGDMHRYVDLTSLATPLYLLIIIY